MASAADREPGHQEPGAKALVQGRQCVRGWGVGSRGAGPGRECLGPQSAAGVALAAWFGELLDAARAPNRGSAGAGARRRGREQVAGMREPGGGVAPGQREYLAAALTARWCWDPRLSRRTFPSSEANPAATITYRS